MFPGRRSRWLAQGGEADFADINAINEDVSELGVVKTGEELDEGQFFRRRWADQGDDAAPFGFEGDVPDDGLGRVVAEGDKIEFHRPFARGEPGCVGSSGNGRVRHRELRRIAGPR